MRKDITILLCLAWMLTLAGCGNSGGTSGKPGSQTASVNDVLVQGMAEADGKNGVMSAAEGLVQDVPSASEAVSSTVRQGESDGGIDVDLTVLSSTMVYSEVYNMMASPEEYIGKTVKIKGQFSCYFNESTGNYYFACINQDATACCAQGIEFVLTGEHTYPDDYPEVYDEICVVGVFDTYQEDGWTYCTLRNATLL